jgi:hypothetical protein
MRETGTSSVPGIAWQKNCPSKQVGAGGLAQLEILIGMDSSDQDSSAASAALCDFRRQSAARAIEPRAFDAN